jgi:hypothetical protein
MTRMSWDRGFLWSAERVIRWRRWDIRVRIRLVVVSGEREYWEQRIVRRERRGGMYEENCVGETARMWWRLGGRD